LGALAGDVAGTAVVSVATSAAAEKIAAKTFAKPKAAAAASKAEVPSPATAPAPAPAAAPAPVPEAAPAAAPAAARAAAPVPSPADGALGNLSSLGRLGEQAKGLLHESVLSELQRGAGGELLYNDCIRLANKLVEAAQNPATYDAAARKLVEDFQQSPNFREFVEGEKALRAGTPVVFTPRSIDTVLADVRTGIGNAATTIRELREGR
jgi:hypothetical protein